MEDQLSKTPNLQLAQIRFSLSQEKCNKNKDPSYNTKIDYLMTEIKKNNMAPFYVECCKELNWKQDSELVHLMNEHNTIKLKNLDERIADAEKNLGETEIRESHLAKTEFLSNIGDKDSSLSQIRKTYEKTATLGHKLDLVFHQIRIGFFYLDYELIKSNIEKAKGLIEEGGDWDRRNRLKVYQGLYSIIIRDFNTAATHFLDTIATFTSYELMDYETFVIYTILCSMYSLSRPELRKKITRGAEILETLHGLPRIKNYVFSLYECRYADFFKSLAFVEQYMKSDRYFNKHFTFYIRDMRILAYNQLLESYSSLTVSYMANAFGTSNQFIDKELSRFIAAGRLNAKIDKVNGIVETNRPDNKNWQYQETVKKGDLLLNRIQKLSRVINI